MNAEPRAGQRILAACRFLAKPALGADKSVWIARRLAHFGRQLFAERPLCATTGRSHKDAIDNRTFVPAGERSTTSPRRCGQITYPQRVG